ncbi:MAG: pirin family protein [Acidobacteriota bacterium]|nr:pirin family protein [Acidobacteriota bacterium]
MSTSDAQIVTASHARVAALDVRRTLPTRARRNIGAWCFADHLGPVSLTPGQSADVAPHPHVGLQTVTWLFDGAFLHRDSLGSAQLIRPGQLNLMSAGNGVAHAEEDPGQPEGRLHGIQLWVAQPEHTRWGPSAFEHLADVPQRDLDAGVATVLLGSLGGTSSPARRDSDLVGAQLQLRAGTSVVEADPRYEYGVIAIAGATEVAGATLTPGMMAYLAPGREELVLSTGDASTVMLIGGVPLETPLVMWWNFVARSREEIADAYRAWASRSERFAPVASKFAPIDVAPPAWLARET